MTEQPGSAEFPFGPAVAPNQPLSAETALNHLKTADDAGRVKALERYDVLETPEEPAFENIVNLVTQILQVPIAAVSLIDAHRQWFKARRGLAVCETSRDISFCTYTIQSPQPFLVRNALEDPRFANNPLVTGEPNIRAYLGIPLRTPDGYNIGSLCAIDSRPRDWPDHEISILTNFAKVVMDELELRQIASTDVLTGAMTRRAWIEAAEIEMARAKRHGHPLSLVVMDLDRFKRVNDTYGHPAGDRVIKALARVMLDNRRGSDLFGRFGGEEFLLLMPQTGTEEAFEAADRLRELFAATPIEIGNGRTIDCTASMGIAALEDADNLDSLLARADRCLYAAKEGGRNRVVASEPDLPGAADGEAAE